MYGMRDVIILLQYILISTSFYVITTSINWYYVCSLTLALVCIHHKVVISIHIHIYIQLRSNILREVIKSCRGKLHIHTHI